MFILLVNFFQDDTWGVTRKLLIITALAIFRVVKIPTLKMPKPLLFSGLQVALAEAVLWRWQAEQRHGPRRIAKHPELSGLLPLPWRVGAPRSNPSNPRGNPRHIKKTGHNWSVFKIYRELNDYSATTSNEKVPFTFL